MNSCSSKYMSFYFPNVAVFYEQHHVSGHDQKLNDSKISFSAVSQWFSIICTTKYIFH